ncbi:MAG: IS1182 family transposase [Chloroflexota bacterium]
MAQRRFRPYDPAAPVLLPGDVREYLPPDHLVFLLSDLVDELDLGPITRSYEQGDGRGQPPYHPVLLTKLLLYAYCDGVTSSRQIARRTSEDLPYWVLCVGQHPDFRTISDFRERHLAAFQDLFVQVVRLAQRLGLARLDHVAQDGTKVLANASKHKAMSYGRMGPTIAKLEGEIAGLLAQARAADAEEEGRYGAGASGDEVPAELAGEVAFRQRRLDRIRAAQAHLEAEAQAAADATRAADAAELARRAETGEPGKPGRVPQPADTPDPTAQVNFTDGDSRILKTSDDAFLQGYNGQVAVDSAHQIVVACELTNLAADSPHLPGLVAQVAQTCGRLPDQWSADGGYFCLENLAVLRAAGVASFIAPGRLHPTRLVGDCQITRLDTPAYRAAAQMAATLATPTGRATYSLRKETAEPVFGQAKEGRGLRRLRCRGLLKAQGEWALWWLTHNLGKLARQRRAQPGQAAAPRPLRHAAWALPRAGTAFAPTAQRRWERPFRLPSSLRAGRYSIIPLHAILSQTNS